MIKVLALVAGIGVVFAHGVGGNTEDGSNRQATVVKTTLGSVKGSVMTTIRGKDIFAFRGIRYAKAPVDDLRFQAPVPVDAWQGVYDASKDAPSCPQPLVEPISEDCLFLYVYTTKLPDGDENPKRPVIVFLHPGGFYGGAAASSIFGPEYFLDKDIVLVVPNYRLGSLGFLSTGTKEAPGNNGLKDQVVALKWVQDNIASFGGDPDSVTILGYSAGSSSVGLHLISPLSKGLFHRGIAMSGAVFGNVPISTNQLDLAKKQARLVNCSDATVTDIISCLKTKSAIDIANSLSGFREFGGDPVRIFLPVIEQDFGQPRFLTAHPVKSILEGDFQKLPFITGVNINEFGFAGYRLTAPGREAALEEYDRDYERVFPISYTYERGTEKSRRISKALRAFYFGKKKIDKTSVDEISKLYADGITGFSVNRAAKIISEKNTAPVYYYRFSSVGRFSYFYLPNTTIPYGTVHHDELISLFYLSTRFAKFNLTDPEYKTVDKLTTMWANFAETGNPIPAPCGKLDYVTWEPFSTKTKKYMEIDHTLKMKEGLYENRYELWEKLFPLSQYLN